MQAARAALAAGLVTLLVGCGVQTTTATQPAPAASEQTTTTAAPEQIDSTTLREAITNDNLVKHLAALQTIADENDGNRASGTSRLRGVPRLRRSAAHRSGPHHAELSYTRDDETITTWNLLADTPGSPDRTIVVGAHLDSVAQGAGINDNATCVAAALETAIQMGRLGVQPAHRVRFAFWAAEEDGLYGSTHYVVQGDDTTALYLNLDMVGSPNPVPSVYDGDHAPEGSNTIQAVLTDALEEQGTEPEPVWFDISDHHPFVQAGVPVGGLYTGGRRAQVIR